MRPAEAPEPHARAPRRQVVSYANFTHTHIHTQTHTLSSTFTLMLKRSYSPYSSVHTCGPAHTCFHKRIYSHTYAWDPTLLKLTVTLPFIPPQHIHPHTVSLILTFIHPHTPIFTGTLMLTTPIQAPVYLHSLLLHLTRYSYSHSSPLHTLAATHRHITHTLQHALIRRLTHPHLHTLSHTLPPPLRTHRVTRFSSPALRLGHAHLLR